MGSEFTEDAKKHPPPKKKGLHNPLDVQQAATLKYSLWSAH